MSDSLALTQLRYLYRGEVSEQILTEIRLSTKYIDKISIRLLFRLRELKKLLEVE